MEIILLLITVFFKHILLYNIYIYMHLIWIYFPSFAMINRTKGNTIYVLYMLPLILPFFFLKWISFMHNLTCWISKKCLNREYDSSVSHYRPHFTQLYRYALIISQQSGWLITKICILYTSLIHMLMIKLAIYIYLKSMFVKFIN